MRVDTTKRTVELTLSSEDMSSLLSHKEICPKLAIDGRDLVIFFPLYG